MKQEPIAAFVAGFKYSFRMAAALLCFLPNLLVAILRAARHRLRRRLRHEPASDDRCRTQEH